MNRLLGVKEAAELLGIKVPTLYKYVCQGTVPVVKIGSRVLFDPDRLAVWVRKHSREPVLQSIQ